MKTAIALIALTVSAAPALAEDLRLETPLAGASMTDAGTSMNVYYDAAEAGYEVVATYADVHAAPARLTMLLSDGDTVSFGLPGKAGTLYTFARTGEAVHVRSTPVNETFASK